MKHEFSYRINLDDLDYMGIVGHANWLLILQRARIELLEALGLSYEFLTQSGTTAVVKSIAMEFLAPARHRDPIRVSVEPVNWTATSLSLRYLVTGPADKHLLECDLKLVFVDKSGKPVRIPAELKRRFEQEIINPGRP